MAAFWEGLVRGVHNADNWKFAQGGNSFVLSLLSIIEYLRLLIVRENGMMRCRFCGIRYLQDDVARSDWTHIRA